MLHVWERGEVHTGFWRGDLRERHNFEHLGVDGRIILKRIFKKWGEEAGTGLIRFMIGTFGERL
jgi:hypothetical protein